MQGFAQRALVMAVFSLLLADLGGNSFIGTARAGTEKIRSAADVKCHVPKAPVIQVLPQTANIRYDFNQTTKELTAQGSNTVNPYGGNVDTTTGGLRADAVKMKSNVKMGTLTYPSLGVGCVWYDSVTVNINLNPVIFVAKEYQQEPCRSAILEHETKHVTVDRIVMNKYAAEVGIAVQKAVNDAGAMGPFNVNEMPGHQERLIEHIQSAIKSKELSLEKEMRRQQAGVDTLDEYGRVSKICKDVIKRRR